MLMVELFDPSRLLPFMVKELGPAVVFIQTFPKSAIGDVNVNIPPVTELMVNVCVFETAAAPVVVTPTTAFPAVDKSDAGISAVNWVGLTNVVVLLLPFHVTTEPFIKFVPLTVSVKAGEPAFADVGEIDVVVGVAGVTAGVTEAHVVPTLIPSIICVEAEAAVPWRRKKALMVVASVAELVTLGIVAGPSVPPKGGFTHKLSTSSTVVPVL